MVANLQMVAPCLNPVSNKHLSMQFFDKLWASTANIKGMGILQTLRQSQNEIEIQHYSSMF